MFVVYDTLVSVAVVAGAVIVATLPDNPNVDASDPAGTDAVGPTDG